MASGILLWLLMALSSSTCIGLPQATTYDIRTMGIPPSKLIQPSPGDLRRSKRSPNSSSPTTQNTTPLSIWQSSEDETFDGSGLSLDESKTEDLNQWLAEEERGPGLGRTKRKVISRGGHYIIRSSNGNSPWSSSSYDSSSTYRTSRPRGYGWNPRGRIGDSGIRTTTFGEVLPLKQEQRSPRKKLARTFKGEIAQYAMLHGANKAALHYEHRVGRRLRERVVEKFVQRYQERVKKSKKKKTRS